jgi:hypothetical protein
MTPSATPPQNADDDLPAEACLDCRLRMPDDMAAEAHARLTGHLIGWSLEDMAEWPVATEDQIYRIGAA